MATGKQINTRWVRKRGLIGGATSLFVEENSGENAQAFNTFFFGASAVTGTLSATEAQDTATFAGKLAYSGSLAATEGQDTASFAGKLVYTGALAATEAQDVASFNGTVAAAAITGTLSATEAQDTAAFDGTFTAGAQTGLHGRKVRGRRIIYPDELDPFVPAKAPKVIEIEPLPSLERAKAALVEAKQALDLAIAAKEAARQAKERAKAIKALETAMGQAQARYDAAQEAENGLIQRLRDEDEFFLLAA